MIYRVRARFKADTAAAFQRKLLDGSIQAQRPDGPEIVASMNRAVMTESGYVEWSETCYCEPPLQHERATVLDQHFEGLSTEVIDSHQQYEGEPFMIHLQQLAGSQPV